MNGQIFNIEHGSFVDGPGIRTTVFFKGCNLKCAWCHNPESQPFGPVKLYYEDKCIHCGRCKEVCPSKNHCLLCGRCATVCPKGALEISGKTVSSEEVLQEILSDRVFYDEEGGATFSGGECLLQPDFLLTLLKKCKKEGIHTAVDTAGNLPWAVFEKILPYTDLFLYDLKVMDPKLHQKYTGVDNTLILENYRRLLSLKKRVIVRVPVIPGVNATEENFRALHDFYVSAGFPEKTELLPYHRLGENKYRALGLTPDCFEVPAEEQLAALKKIVGN